MAVLRDHSKRPISEDTGWIPLKVGVKIEEGIGYILSKFHENRPTRLASGALRVRLRANVRKCGEKSLNISLPLAPKRSIGWRWGYKILIPQPKIRLGCEC